MGSNEPDAPIDLLAIHLAGARLHPEASHARPQEYYGDPARIVKLEGETRRKLEREAQQRAEKQGRKSGRGSSDDCSRIVDDSKCSTCFYSRPGKSGLFCGKGQVYGKRCEFFRLMKK